MRITMGKENSESIFSLLLSGNMTRNTHARRTRTHAHAHTHVRAHAHRHTFSLRTHPCSVRCRQQKREPSSLQGLVVGVFAGKDAGRHWQGPRRDTPWTGTHADEWVTRTCILLSLRRYDGFAHNAPRLACKSCARMVRVVSLHPGITCSIHGIHQSFVIDGPTKRLGISGQSVTTQGVV